MCCLCSAAPLSKGSFDMISISADEASEDEQPGILHFNGHFLMQSTDWQLTSEEATVYGSPDKPDRVYLEGSPASFLINRNDRKNQGQIKATAQVVEYLGNDNLLKLSGGATLVLDDEVIRSNQIEYDINTNRYRASGTDGVQIEVPPVR
jgi:lipopolysaccharide transport protein LptA